jgi:hypothetical protein
LELSSGLIWTARIRPGVEDGDSEDGGLSIDVELIDGLAGYDAGGKEDVGMVFVADTSGGAAALEPPLDKSPI